MEKVAWKGIVKEGMMKEYIRRHDEIWPEMSQTLTEAGIRNYSIWNHGHELFGVYECEKGTAYALEYQATSPVVARWNEYMKDILSFEMDPETGKRSEWVQVFGHRED